MVPANCTPWLAGHQHISADDCLQESEFSRIELTEELLCLTVNLATAQQLLLQQ